MEQLIDLLQQSGLLIGAGLAILMGTFVVLRAGERVFERAVERRVEEITGDRQSTAGRFGAFLPSYGERPRRSREGAPRTPA